MSSVPLEIDEKPKDRGAPRLEDFALAQLPPPHHGFTVRFKECLPANAATPVVEAFEDQIAEEVEVVRELLRSIGLPEKLRDHPLYPVFLLGHFPIPGERVDEESPLFTRRNILGFVPPHPDITGVMEILGRIARHIMDNLPDIEEGKRATIAKALVNGMLRILDGHIRSMDEQPVFERPGEPRRTRWVDLFAKSQAKLEGFSPREVRKAGQSILKTLTPQLAKATTTAEKESLLQEACVRLMRELGILGRELSARERGDFLKDEMPSCVSKAKALYKRIGRSLVRAQRTFHIRGSQVNTDMVEENEYRTPIELLQIILEHPRTPESYDSGDLRELNEALAIFSLSYNFFLTRRDPRYKEARARELTFRRNLAENLFGKKHRRESVDVKLDARGNILDDDAGDYDYSMTEELRLLEIPEMPDEFKHLRVFLDESRRKDSEALVIKRLLYPDYRLDRDVFDFLGGRLFVWDITLKDFKESADKEKIRQGLNAVARRAGEAMGLTYRARTPRQKLKKGEFCIIDKLATNPTNERSNDFPAMKVYGLTEEGVPVEFQIVLRDGYNAIQSADSPSNTEFYDLLKDIGLLKILKPASVFPDEHKIAEEILSALEKRRERWAQAHPVPDTPVTSS